MSVLDYPIVETSKYPTLLEACIALDLSWREYDRHAARSQAAGHDIVILPEVTFGEPDLQMCGAVITRPGEPVIVGIATLSAARASLLEVEHLVSGCRDDAVLVGRPVHIGTLAVDTAEASH